MAIDNTNFSFITFLEGQFMSVDECSKFEHQSSYLYKRRHGIHKCMFVTVNTEAQASVHSAK